MDSETETEVSHFISPPCATPTHTKVGNPTIIQSQLESLNKRWIEIQSDLGSEIESIP